jgi:mannose-6-phosphate isomerase class I
MRQPNYDKYPSTKVGGTVWQGWNSILGQLDKTLGSSRVWAVDLYTGTIEEEIVQAFQRTGRRIVLTKDLMRSEAEVLEMTRRFMTDDVLFGYISNVRLAEYFDESKVRAFKESLQKEHLIIIGTGAASLVPDGVPVVYADMARWEIQQRFRRHQVRALGVDNHGEAPSLQYKRGFFNDWNICDRHKCRLAQSGRIVYWIDTNVAGQPKMISHGTFMAGIRQTARKPFRPVPFFDPAPWGGQWMKRVCDLDRQVANYGWCFDCVPEENSLYFDVEGVRFELPCQDLVMLETRNLLGETVESRFGKSFPIRFDFLDTVGGGNLSLQVHPTTEFVHENFGIHYTQDESYYLLDAEPGATVYLGLREGIDPAAMIGDLRSAQNGGEPFDAEKYVNRWPAKKHDHFLIPGGTVHCSGAGALVLEISSTPNLFTFKLWDWQRLGLDGKPRPINIERGRQVIDFGRDTAYARRHLINRVEPVARGDGWTEERTGLHPNEFIETRRHWFTAPVVHHTEGGVNVLNLVEGDEAIVESPSGAFEPFVVHYAETFVVPACVGEYTIRPYGASAGRQCGTIKAYVRK